MLTVGILGGMGPMATVDLFGKIVECTPASLDQEHLKIIIYNNPQIPSRIDSIINGTESPIKELIGSAQFLEKAGVDMIVMACNTAHFWYEEIRDAVHVTFINMIENTADHVWQQYGDGKNGQVMLFATAATVKTELYQKAFLTRGMPLLTPSLEEQKVISLAIQEVKAGRLADNSYLKLVDEIILKYQKAGVNSFIAGCTEIPLLFKCIPREYCRIDPTLLLAQEVVKRALK